MPFSSERTLSTNAPNSRQMVWRITSACLHRCIGQRVQSGCFNSMMKEPAHASAPIQTHARAAHPGGTTFRISVGVGSSRITPSVSGRATVPGLAGAVVHNECKPLEVPIPPEFQGLCDVYDVGCPHCSSRIHSRSCPQDGYCSNGDTAQFLAREYFRHVHLCLKMQVESSIFVEAVSKKPPHGL